jgi:ABC-type transport system involved in multi-copper enzyme maturation permease subunit
MLGLLDKRERDHDHHPLRGSSIVPLHPFLHVELTATARRARTYGLRALYGIALFFFFGLRYRGFARRPASGIATIHEQAAFARTTFEWFLLFQGMVFVLLAPILFAGSVADESQRKTLPLLLASRLGSGEILLGKLSARMLHVLTFLVLGLPVVSLLGLFGGVDPLLVAMAAVGMFSTAFFLASVSLLISVHARNPREAMTGALMVTLAWLIAPYVIHHVPASRPWILWVKTVSEWVYSTLPLIDLARMAWLARGGPLILTRPFATMVGMQLVTGLAFFGLAAYRLRPAYRARQDAPRRRSRLFRPRAFPPCGDDPMLWKECHGGDRDGATRLLIVLGLAFGAVVLLLYNVSFRELYRNALEELYEFGYDVGPLADRGQYRLYLGNLLAMFADTLSVPFLLVVAVASASGIAGERERGTWTSLVATPLGRWEILRAKMLGAIRAGGPLGLLAVLPWMLGLALGATHPLGFLAAVVGLAAFAWFVAALGTAFSLRSKTTSRAVGRTLGTLLAINLLPILVLGCLFGAPGVWDGGPVLGCMPMILDMLPVSRRGIENLVYSIHVNAGVVTGGSLPGPMHSVFAALVLANVLAYAAVGWLIAWRAFEVFQAGREPRGR